MLFRGLISAVRILTIVPVGGQDAEKPFYSLPWFPVVGVLLGTIQFYCIGSFRLLPHTLDALSGIACVAVNFILTGGLHLDGLTDTADAFGTPHSREKTLEILKDPHIGAFGAAAAVFFVIWRVAVCQGLYYHSGEVSIITALASSRCIQGILLMSFPYARGRNGKAYGFKGNKAVFLLVISELMGIILYSCLIWDWKKIIIPFIGGFLAIAILICLSLKRIGGITGDIVGASTELYECVFITGVLAGL